MFRLATSSHQEDQSRCLSANSGGLAQNGQVVPASSSSVKRVAPFGFLNIYFQALTVAPRTLGKDA
jgi:hypothetical protein